MIKEDLKPDFEALARMLELKEKMQECEAAIKFRILSGPELRLVSADRREYEKEFQRLKTQLKSDGKS